MPFGFRTGNNILPRDSRVPRKGRRTCVLVGVRGLLPLLLQVLPQMSPRFGRVAPPVAPPCPIVRRAFPRNFCRSVRPTPLGWHTWRTGTGSLARRRDSAKPGLAILPHNGGTGSGPGTHRSVTLKWPPRTPSRDEPRKPRTRKSHHENTPPNRMETTTKPIHDWMTCSFVTRFFVIFSAMLPQLLFLPSHQASKYSMEAEYYHLEHVLLREDFY